MQTIKNKLRRKLLAAVVMASITLCLGIAAMAQEGAGSIYLPVIASGNSASSEEPANQPPTDPLQQAIDILAAHPEFALHLANYTWRGDGYLDGDQQDVYYLWFYDESNDEWLGDGRVNIVTGEIISYYAPRERTPEEYQEGLAKIETFLQSDAEVRARQGNPDLWYHDVSYNRWDGNWEVYYSYGIDEFVVTLTFYEDDVNLESILNPNLFEAEEAAELARNQAVELAYQANNIDEALNGFDDWRAYAEHQGNARWTVEFVVDGQEIFHALVDIDAQQVLESGP